MCLEESKSVLKIGSLKPVFPKMADLCYEICTFQIELSQKANTCRTSAIHHLKALNLAILTLYGTYATSIGFLS